MSCAKSAQYFLFTALQFQSVLLSVILFEPQVITEKKVSSHFGNEIIVA